MKVKQLVFFLVLLNISCNVTEKDVVGVYKLKKSRFNSVIINSDHSFFFEYFDAEKFQIKHIEKDSCHFITRGNWELKKNKLILNSYHSFSDTSRTKEIIKTPSNSKVSNFSFKDINGRTLYFSSASNLKYYSSETITATIVDAYFSNVDMEAFKGDILIFNFINYKPLHYIIEDSLIAKYVVTIAPYYRQGYFNNKIFTVKRNGLKSNNVKFKKDKSIKNAPTI